MAKFLSALWFIFMVIGYMFVITVVGFGGWLLLFKIISVIAGYVNNG